MRPARSFLHFWYDFIIGDDATITVGVVLALGATAILAYSHRPAWWLLPAAVIVLLTISLTRAIHRRR